MVTHQFPYVLAGVAFLAGQLAHRPLVPRDVGGDRARPQVIFEAEGAPAIALLADLGPVVARRLVIWGSIRLSY